MNRRGFLRGAAIGAAVVAAAPVLRLFPVINEVKPIFSGAAIAIDGVKLTNFGVLSPRAKMVWSRHYWDTARNEAFLSHMLDRPNSILERVTMLDPDRTVFGPVNYGVITVDARYG